MLTFEPPYNVAGCQAAARVLAGDAEAADADLLRATRAAGAAGGLGASKFFPAVSVLAAIARGDLEAADSRWAALEPYEERALADGSGAARLFACSSPMRDWIWRMGASRTLRGA